MTRSKWNWLCLWSCRIRLNLCSSIKGLRCYGVGNGRWRRLIYFIIWIFIIHLSSSVKWLSSNWNFCIWLDWLNLLIDWIHLSLHLRSFSNLHWWNTLSGRSGHWIHLRNLWHIKSCTIFGHFWIAVLNSWPHWWKSRLPSIKGSPYLLLILSLKWCLLLWIQLVQIFRNASLLFILTVSNYEILRIHLRLWNSLSCLWLKCHLILRKHLLWHLIWRETVLWNWTIRWIWLSSRKIRLLFRRLIFITSFLVIFLLRDHLLWRVHSKSLRLLKLLGCLRALFILYSVYYWSS